MTTSTDDTRAAIAIWWLSLIVLTLVICVHFSLVEIVNLPLNPIQASLIDITSDYVHPLFQQNWNFFAPQPVDHDVTVIARARVCAVRKCSTTTWLDISDPLIASVRRNRLSSLELIQLMLSNAAIQFSNEMRKDPRATRVGKAGIFVNPTVPDRVDPIDAIIILRTSAAAIRITHPGRRFDEIQFGLHSYQFPRFSSRALPDAPGAGTLTLTEWEPFPNDIATFED